MYLINIEDDKHLQKKINSFGVFISLTCFASSFKIISLYNFFKGNKVMCNICNSKPSLQYFNHGVKRLSFNQILVCYKDLKNIQEWETRSTQSSKTLLKNI